MAVFLHLPLFMAVLAASASACDDFMYNSTVERGAFSMRALDQGYNVYPSFSYVPRGAQLQGFRTRADGPVLNYQSAYGFATVSGAQAQIAANASALGFTTAPLGMGIDGLNEQGMSCALLFDPNSNETFTRYNGTGTVISVLDWVHYSLAMYASVEEARTAIKTGAVHLSEAYDSIPAVQNVFANPYHIVMRDASHDQLVIEYQADGQVLTFDDRTYVLTNGPNFEKHLEQLAAWLSPQEPGARPTYLTVPQTEPFYENLTFSADNQTAYTSNPDKWWGFPGDHASSSRFIRLSMLNMIAQGSLQYPTAPSQLWSPAAYPGNFPWKPLFTATESFMNTVLLPLGVDDKGGVYPPDDKVSDFWLFQVMRNHVDKLFWFKTPSSPMWKLIDVGLLASRPQAAYNGYSLLPDFGANRTWWEDVTALAASSSEVQQEAEDFQQELEFYKFPLP